MSTASPKPASTNPSPGRGYLILWGAIAPSLTGSEEDALNDWWTNEHLPDRLQLPGFKRARRYYTRSLSSSRSSTSASNAPRKYLAIYEVESIKDLMSDKYLQKLESPTTRTRAFMPTLSQFHRSACETVFPRIRYAERDMHLTGNWIVVMVLHGRDLDVEKTVETLRTVYKERTDACAIELLRHDEWITSAGSSTASYKGVQFNMTAAETKIEEEKHGRSEKYIVLLDFCLPATTCTPVAENAVGEFCERIGECGGQLAEWEAYQLLCEMRRD